MKTQTSYLMGFAVLLLGLITIQTVTAASVSVAVKAGDEIIIKTRETDISDVTGNTWNAWVFHKAVISEVKMNDTTGMLEVWAKIYNSTDGKEWVLEKVEKQQIGNFSSDIIKMGLQSFGGASYLYPQGLKIGTKTAEIKALMEGSFAGQPVAPTISVTSIEKDMGFKADIGQFSGASGKTWNITLILESNGILKNFSMVMTDLTSGVPTGVWKTETILVEANIAEDEEEPFIAGFPVAIVGLLSAMAVFIILKKHR